MQALLERRVPDALAHPRFVSEVLAPLKVEALLETWLGLALTLTLTLTKVEALLETW